MKLSNHKPCQIKHFKHFWHGTGEVVWPLSVTGSFYFRLFFCCHKWQRCGTKLQNSLRHGQQGRWPLSLTRKFSTNQTIKPCKTHDFSNFWHGLGNGGSVSPRLLTGLFFCGLFFILLPPVVTLWNQTVEFVWHGQQGGGQTPFTDWIDLFF